MSDEKPVNEYREQRIENMNQLAEAGYAPFGAAFDRTARLDVLHAGFEADKVVSACGRIVAIRKMGKMAFAHIGIDLEFTGVGINEIAKIKSCSNPDYQIEIGKEVLSVDPKYFRPTEVDLLIGDPTKAKEKLGWVPEIQLEELVQDMMESDLKLFKRDKYLSEGGHDTFNYYE